MPKPSLAQRVNNFAPFVAFVALAAMIAIGGIAAVPPKNSEAYWTRVRVALEGIPYRIDSSVGVDEEPTPAAVKLLRPNHILQRRYVDTSTGAVMSLLVVHCQDVRDIIGHYPPVCYPAHGWQPRESRVVSVEAEAGRVQQATYFSFLRPEGVTTRRLVTLNFFVLPGENRIIPDMNTVEKASRASSRAGLGVAQFQIVMNEEQTTEALEAKLRETLQALEPAIRTIAEGMGP